MFQSTHPRGVRRRRTISRSIPTWSFNPRTRVGCDAAGMPAKYARGISFNPRTRVGCDALEAAQEWGYESVSIHAPAWGATSTLEKAKKAEDVSIHAPAWGATRKRTLCTPRACVSIHAPAWGATPACRWWWHWRCSFNPRTRVGCDPLGQVARDLGGLVSIHAPAWGATRRSTGARPLWGSRFNPRTRVGCDSWGRFDFCH